VKTLDLEKMPRVDRLLRHPDLAGAVSALGTARVTELVRAELEDARAGVLGGARSATPTEDEAAHAVAQRAKAVSASRARRVINATGVLLHTNLGRAPLSEAARRALVETATGYTSIELDLATGKRGRRAGFAEDALALLAGAEAAIVVNNCAAAVLLTLTALARGKDVIVSRGELVEIGGGFRIPEILEESGARLVEVGTTNKTRLADYARALERSERKGAILRVHQGNFKMTGFVERPRLAELAAVAHEHGVPLVKDLGGGAVVDLARYGFMGEPTIADSIRGGADIVCFSTDKALGGPQGGAIVGKRELVERARKAPLARAVRAGRLPLVALEATLASYLLGEAESVPTIGLAARPLAALEARAQTWAERINAPPLEAVAHVVSTETEMGGGTLAGELVRSFGVVLRASSSNGASRSAEEIAALLRRGDSPVLGRIVDDGVVLDARSVLDGADDALVAAVRVALIG
jgi:L-seryl-tRNA(Ser) seleniumtransferase